MHDFEHILALSYALRCVIGDGVDNTHVGYKGLYHRNDAWNFPCMHVVVYQKHVRAWEVTSHLVDCISRPRLIFGSSSSPFVVVHHRRSSPSLTSVAHKQG